MANGKLELTIVIQQGWIFAMPQVWILPGTNPYQQDVSHEIIYELTQELKNKNSCFAKSAKSF